MDKIPLTVVILAKDAAETIANALESVQFSSSIIVIDDGSTDETLSIAKKYDARIASFPDTDFATKRTKALELVKTDWLVYVDADEIVSDELRRKIEEIVGANVPGAYQIKRKNIFLGQEMYSDFVDRLFHRTVITGWRGKVHESPVLTVKPQVVMACLNHDTHRDITSMLTKTNQWSEYEAELRIEAHHPVMVWWRLVRIGITFFCSNYFGKRLYRYGRAGLFESYFQMVDKLIVYTKLWERQQKVVI